MTFKEWLKINYTGDVISQIRPWWINTLEKTFKAGRESMHEDAINACCYSAGDYYDCDCRRDVKALEP